MFLKQISPRQSKINGERSFEELLLFLYVHRNQLKTRYVMSTEAQATLTEDIGNQVCIVSVCACVLCV